MSAQMLELLFFAGIAFFIINRLISTLGVTNDDDPTKEKTFFGEKSGIKDVTGNSNVHNIKEASFIEKKTASSVSKDSLSDVVANDNISKIFGTIEEIQERLPSFNPRNFLKSSKSAFEMIITSGSNTNESLELLIDKRYIDHFKSIIASYGDIEKSSGLEAKISDIYTFGNNVFIKVLFSGKNIVTKIKDFHEEWTFSKSLIQAGPDWFLTNIERPQ
jgi:predicted lipid-binding transport protein (Tim44 family)